MEGRFLGTPLMTNAPTRSKLLITGASGLVGGALLERLEGEAPLRALVRTPASSRPAVTSRWSRPTSQSGRWSDAWVFGTVTAPTAIGSETKM